MIMVHLLHLLVVMMMRWRYSIPVGVLRGFSVEIECEKPWC